MESLGKFPRLFLETEGLPWPPLRPPASSSDEECSSVEELG